MRSFLSMLDVVADGLDEIFAPLSKGFIKKSTRKFLHKIGIVIFFLGISMLIVISFINVMISA